MDSQGPTIPPTLAAGEEAELRAHYLPDAMLVVRDGVTLRASSAARGVLGWDPSSIADAPLETIVHPDDRGIVREACRAAAVGEAVACVVHARRGEGGAYVALEALFRPRDSDQIPTDVVVGLRRIDETAVARDLASRATAAARHLADRAGDLSFLVDGFGVVHGVGYAAYEMLGWLPDELVGLQLPDLIHPDDLEISRRYRQAVREDTAEGSVQIRVRTRGGSFRWVGATGVVVTDAGNDDAATRILVSWRDIDGLVRDMRFAEREATRLRLIMDTALDPWLVLGPLRDRRGHVTDFVIEDANQGAAEYLRWPRDRLLGSHLLEEFPNVADHGLMATYVDAIESGEGVTIHDLAYPHEVFGETRMYEIRVQAVAGSLMLTWRDTTPASLARNELARSESFFRRVACSAGSAIVAIEQGSVTWVSPGAEALGLEPGSDFEAVMSGLVVPDSVPAVRAACLLAEGGHAYSGRWHRPAAPALTVRLTPTRKDRGSWVATLIEESWTERPGATPPVAE